jgi:prophage regulatory protein
METNNNTLANIESLLLAQQRVLTVKQLSSYTGFSTSFIHKLTSTKRIPFSRPNGKLIVFDREKIEEWLLSNEVSPVEDVEQEAINYVSNKSWKGFGK